VFFIKS